MIHVAGEPEEMKALALFTNLIFEYDVLGFYSEDEKCTKALSAFLTDYKSDDLDNLMYLS